MQMYIETRCAENILPTEDSAHILLCGEKFISLSPSVIF